MALTAVPVVWWSLLAINGFVGIGDSMETLERHAEVVSNTPQSFNLGLAKGLWIAGYSGAMLSALGMLGGALLLALRQRAGVFVMLGTGVVAVLTPAIRITYDYITLQRFHIHEGFLTGGIMGLVVAVLALLPPVMRSMRPAQPAPAAPQMPRPGMPPAQW